MYNKISLNYPKHLCIFSHCLIYIYADDTKFSREVGNILDQTILQKDLNAYQLGQILGN